MCNDTSFSYAYYQDDSKMQKFGRMDIKAIQEKKLRSYVYLVEEFCSESTKLLFSADGTTVLNYGHRIGEN